MNRLAIFQQDDSKILSGILDECPLLEPSIRLDPCFCWVINNFLNPCICDHNTIRPFSHVMEVLRCFHSLLYREQGFRQMFGLIGLEGLSLLLKKADTLIEHADMLKAHMPDDGIGAVIRIQKGMQGPA